MKRLIFWGLFLFSVTGCASVVQHQTVDLGGGIIATYVTGKRRCFGTHLSMASL